MIEFSDTALKFDFSLLLGLWRIPITNALWVVWWSGGCLQASISESTEDMYSNQWRAIGTHFLNCIGQPLGEVPIFTSKSYKIHLNEFLSRDSCFSSSFWALWIFCAKTNIHALIRVKLDARSIEFTASMCSCTRKFFSCISLWDDIHSSNASKITTNKNKSVFWVKRGKYQWYSFLTASNLSKYHYGAMCTEYLCEWRE